MRQSHFSGIITVNFKTNNNFSGFFTVNIKSDNKLPADMLSTGMRSELWHGHLPAACMMMMYYNFPEIRKHFNQTKFK